MCVCNCTGNRLYKVKLVVDDDELYGNCNCPLGENEEFCKHQVALGLAFIHADKQAKTRKNKSLFDWEKFVKNSSREDVEKIVFEMSKRCPEIVEKYRMENLPLIGNVLASELKIKIDSLCELAEDCGYNDNDYYDEYDDSNEAIQAFRQGQKQLEIALDKIAAHKNYKLLFKISEYAIAKIKLISTYEEYEVSDFLYSMLNYYVKSTSFGIVSPEHLLHKIKSWENNDSYCGFGNLSVLFYELPKEVKALWYEYALEEWKKLPVLKMEEKSCSNSRRRLEKRLLTLAKERKDEDIVLKILKSNLSTAKDVLALIEEYRKRKMTQKILPLLQEAKSVLNYCYDIRDALVAEYQSIGNHDEALLVAWKDFEKKSLYEEPFNFLMKTAKQAKCKTQYFEKALNFLEENELKGRKSGLILEGIRSRRIEIFLDARKYEQAWELGKNVNCGKELKLRLAKWRSKENPLEAAEICEKLLKTELEPAGKNYYEEVIKLLKIYKEYLTIAQEQKTFQ